MDHSFPSIVKRNITNMVSNSAILMKFKIYIDTEEYPSTLPRDQKNHQVDHNWFLEMKYFRQMLNHSNYQIPGKFSSLVFPIFSEIIVIIFQQVV